MKNKNENHEFVYIFHGEGAKFAASIYSDLASAKRDLYRLKLTGILTIYPVGKTIFDYVVEEGLFSPKDDKTSKYIQCFSSAYLEHYHFENGEIAKD